MLLLDLLMLIFCIRDLGLDWNKGDVTAYKLLYDNFNVAELDAGWLVFPVVLDPLQSGSRLL